MNGMIMCKCIMENRLVVSLVQRNDLCLENAWLLFRRTEEQKVTP